MIPHSRRNSCRGKKQSEIKELDTAKFQLKELQQEMKITESINQLLTPKIKESKSLILSSNGKHEKIA